jgi:GTP pyrophosphokinase
VSVKKATDEEALAGLGKEYGAHKSEDLYSAIGFGKLSARQILVRLFPDLVTAEGVTSASEKESKIASVVKRVLGRGDSPIIVKGNNDMLVYLAKCCNPIRGEEIAGYITRGKGISVHSMSCPNIEALMGSAERRIEVQWADAQEALGYMEKLVVLTEDRPGVLADLTAAIAGIHSNIRDIHAVTNEDRRGIIDITLEVRDIQHLKKVMQCIKEVKGVYEVDRKRKAS